MLSFLLWCLLFVLCWPLALLGVLLYPFVWLILLPFRLVGIAVEGALVVLRGRKQLGRLAAAVDADDDGDAEHALDHAAEHVPGQHRGAGDGHGPEPGDDALGHVHRDRDRRALRRAGHRLR